MKICIIAEGCYPYVVGGVSSWIHSMIRSFPEHEFVVLAIVANREMRGRFVYELPDNLSAVYEVYLDDKDYGGRGRRTGKRLKLSEREYMALRSLVLNLRVDWDTIFDMFARKNISVNDLLMGADFLKICMELYEKKYPEIVFSDFLWTMRSIYLPLVLALESDLPEADCYHCIATGYAGVLGSMAAHVNGGGLLLSEHGIYTREREEELIKARWVRGVYKNIWTEQFHKMSSVIYERADRVTSLFGHARELQIELGCPEAKTVITSNGVNIDRFANLPGKNEEDKNFVNVGAVLRVTPIKDVKTMIQAFGFAKARAPKLKLWIMGPENEDEAYAAECHALVESLRLSDVVFTGRVDVTQYLGRMDFTILTSISEGQPLTVLEGFAAKKPAIATDVGCCRELLYGGEGDDCGPAGILTHIMNIGEIADAMVTLAMNPKLASEYGKNGYSRVTRYYRIDQMVEKYRNIYRSIEEKYKKD
ncbi:MAG: GT4 family glycosyltransferase PelF [Eubacterium sp.]|nr:GT4 family glycosyltransferase PelF [Eubacterium sp.]